MTCENFEEIFQLIKDDTIKENTKSRETQSHSDCNLQPQLAFYQLGNHTRITFMSIAFFTQQ